MPHEPEKKTPAKKPRKQTAKTKKPAKLTEAACSLFEKRHEEMLQQTCARIAKCFPSHHIEAILGFELDLGCDALVVRIDHKDRLAYSLESLDAIEQRGELSLDTIIEEFIIRGIEERLLARWSGHMITMLRMNTRLRIWPATHGQNRRLVPPRLAKQAA